ncbi:transposase [Actinoplanes sp. NPDC049548]|uniref:transposase n=1 Tax=Actinoplanes sp. NPDC049548 TaxID=3155152 RepID=UPI003433F548
MKTPDPRRVAEVGGWPEGHGVTVIENPPGNGRPPTWENGSQQRIRWRIRIGAPWHDVPAAYAPWPTVYGLFRRWQRDGPGTRSSPRCRLTATPNAASTGQSAWTL